MAGLNTLCLFGVVFALTRAQTHIDIYKTSEPSKQTPAELGIPERPITTQIKLIQTQELSKPPPDTWTTRGQVGEGPAFVQLQDPNSQSAKDILQVLSGGDSIRTDTVAGAGQRVTIGVTRMENNMLQKALINEQLQGKGLIQGDGEGAVPTAIEGRNQRHAVRSARVKRQNISGASGDRIPPTISSTMQEGNREPPAQPTRNSMSQILFRRLQKNMPFGNGMPNNTAPGFGLQHQRQLKIGFPPTMSERSQEIPIQPPRNTISPRMRPNRWSRQNVISSNRVFNSAFGNLNTREPSSVSIPFSLGTGINPYNADAQADAADQMSENIDNMQSMKPTQRSIMSGGGVDNTQAIENRIPTALLPRSRQPPIQQSRNNVAPNMELYRWLQQNRPSSTAVSQRDVPNMTDQRPSGVPRNRFRMPQTMPLGSTEPPFQLSRNNITPSMQLYRWLQHNIPSHASQRDIMRMNNLRPNVVPGHITNVRTNTQIPPTMPQGSRESPFQLSRKNITPNVQLNRWLQQNIPSHASQRDILRMNNLRPNAVPGHIKNVRTNTQIPPTMPQGSRESPFQLSRNNITPNVQLSRWLQQNMPSSTNVSQRDVLRMNNQPPNSIRRNRRPFLTNTQMQNTFSMLNMPDVNLADVQADRADQMSENIDNMQSMSPLDRLLGGGGTGVRIGGNAGQFHGMPGFSSSTGQNTGMSGVNNITGQVTQTGRQEPSAAFTVEQNVPNSGINLQNQRLSLLSALLRSSGAGNGGFRGGFGL